MSTREPVSYFSFEFSTATRIVFGRGKFKQLPQILSEFGTKIFIVTGKRHDLANQLKGLLNEKNQVEIFSVVGEPTTEITTEGLVAARKFSPDVVVALGGGSPIDCGKAIAMLLTNEGEPLDYLEVIGKGKKISHRSKPFIAVPTTSGTGAEVTKNSVLRSDTHAVKVSLRATTMLPDVALVDPELTISAPRSVTVSTGLDAFTQCLESFVCNLSNPLTDTICREGLKRARSLQRACEHPTDLDAREDMAICSLFGGLALANSKLGAVHGFAGPLGGKYPDAPHGAVCAALLPHVIEINVKALKDRDPNNIALKKYHELGKILTEDPSADAAAAVKWVKDLCAALTVPKLSTYGVAADHIPELVDKSAVSSSMKGNPIELTKAELTHLLELAL
eukprot:TRINITY_DN5502_c0_g1_i1.p1 TRINITY_DN5502_c0_g1~~TRINITY_DN5502_c0_g1_i1.p1  ORF type:complete len:393 (-),score=81.14 TRINITY_DN5502_c0_g1_i1:27-1205(-)